MEVDRWRQVDKIFHDALEQEQSQRTSFLDRVCGTNLSLRNEVDALLASHEVAGSFLSSHQAAPISGSLAGKIFGSYEVKSLLGAGGMGEVYRGWDCRLKREVAIKVLLDEFCRDSERLTRFQREAEILASLNHPCIAAIYDVTDFGTERVLVLELVEGVTLADRLRRGPVPIDEALQIGSKIAEALEAAHEKGIIHRDLKPDNIKVTDDGNVKLLDFGLAKVLHADGEELSHIPTKVTASGMGLVLGTPAYMSPEQAKGATADRASDVWAFGCVLYEMLTGHHTFPGKTVTEILAGVLKSEPDWKRLPPATPPGIRRLLRRCLQREEKLRLRDARDARIEINEAQNAAQESLAPVAPRRSERLAWISGLALIIVVAVLAVLWASHFASAAREVHLEITTPPTANPESLAISPDGQKIVFAATSEGHSQLWLRSLDSGSPQPLAATGGATLPFWSPDSQRVGFFADGKLKTIDINGGAVEQLADAPVGEGGAWGADGTILFAPAPAGPIFRTSSARQTPVAVTTPAAGVGHHLPQFLPDGRHFLYYEVGNPEARGVYVQQIDRPDARRLLDADAAAVYAPSGQLLFVLQGTLFGQDFDLARLELTGHPFPVAKEMVVSEYTAALSASATGSIVYRTGAASGQRRLIWFDRSGVEIGSVGSSDITTMGASLSRDGRRMALFRQMRGIWLLETERGVLNKFTDDASSTICPVWSPNDSHVLFSSNRNGPMNLYLKSAAGSGTEELILDSPQSKCATDWSSDGRFLLFSQGAKTGNDIWALPFTPAGKRNGEPVPILQTINDEHLAQFSPDGKWIAYQSNKSGRYEIYVQPFSASGGETLVSTGGGRQVRWRHDGKELFYVALDARLMAVPIRFVSNGQAVELDKPVPLFITHVGGRVSPNMHQYMVSRDNQRFLMNTVAEEASSPIAVILNWKAKP